MQDFSPGSGDLRASILSSSQLCCVQLTEDLMMVSFISFLVLSPIFILAVLIGVGFLKQLKGDVN